MITYPDQNNGSGLRVVLWLSGCSHHCKGCQNPQTWDPESGIPFDRFAEEEVFKELEKDYISGITFSGGDPLHENNIDEVYNLCLSIYNNYSTKNIWLYTGYTWNQIFYPVVTDDLNIKRDEIIDKRKEIVKLCDVLVDGRYEEDKRSPNLPWVGSSNQRVINVQESLDKGEIVLWTN
jgi:anaerobic ribonucleoside-triphosphate reductase activating protein